MRPIDNIPIPTNNGKNKTYSDYQEWRKDLVEAYGQHCIYCNDRLQSRFEVEHASPQSLGVVSPLLWDNLYLACGPCNLAKSAKPATSNTHYFPNSNNTHLIFHYSIRKHKSNGKFACIPVFNSSLSTAQRVKVINTISYTELNRIEQNPNRERRMTDVRWLNRYNAFEVTRSQRVLWDTLTTKLQQDAYLEAIQPLLDKTGFFSLWMNAFNGVVEVLRLIVNSLPNTSVNSFDNSFNPIFRNPSDPIDPI